MYHVKDKYMVPYLNATFTTPSLGKCSKPKVPEVCLIVSKLL